MTSVLESDGDVTVMCLQVPIAVPATLAGLCRHLPTTSEPCAGRVDDAGPTGVAALTALAVRHTPLLAIHAAVVGGPAGALAVPAASGAGKSTLTAALVARGFEYLSDEVLALDRSTGEVIAFARPLALAAASWDVVTLPALRPPDGHEGFVDPADLGRVRTAPTRVAYVVVPRRGEHPTRITPARPGEVLAALVPRCFNHFRDTGGTLHRLADIATAAQGWFATYLEAPALADALAEATGL